jgi:hypothetical protein
VIELKAPDVTIASTTAETMCAIKAAYAFFSAISKLPHDDSGNCQKYQVLIDFVRLLQNTKIKIPKIAKRVEKKFVGSGCWVQSCAEDARDGEPPDAFPSEPRPYS